MCLTSNASVELCIRIDSSNHGKEVVFNERLSPAFLDLPNGDELSLTSDIIVSGRAYQASDWVMIHADVVVSMRLPCAICNEMAEFSVTLMPWEQSMPASSVKNGMLDVSEELREAILLEVPFFIRCNGDTCRNAEEVRKYLVSEDEKAANDGEERNQPFLSLLERENI
jgi:uncharacterized metal-binding protein YceD (DUF177 family)